MIRSPWARRPARPSGVVRVSVLSSMSTGGRAEHHVAEHRRRHEHALGRAGRDRQQDVVDERPAELVEDDQLAAARCDGEPVVAGHAMDLVRVQPGGVDDPACRQRALRRVDPPLPAVQPAQARDPGEAAQLDAGEDGLRGAGQRRRPRADDVLVGHLQRAERSGAEVRLATVQLVDADRRSAVIAVAAGVVFDGGQALELLVGPGDEQRARALERDTDVFGVVEQQAVATRDEPGLHRAGLGVKAGVQDRGVGLAGTGADIARHPGARRAAHSAPARERRRRRRPRRR